MELRDLCEVQAKLLVGIIRGPQGAPGGTIGVDLPLIGFDPVVWVHPRVDGVAPLAAHAAFTTSTELRELETPVHWDVGAAGALIGGRQRVSQGRVWYRDRAITPHTRITSILVSKLTIPLGAPSTEGQQGHEGPQKNSHDLTPFRA